MKNREETWPDKSRFQHQNQLAAAWSRFNEARSRLAADHFYARLGREGLVRQFHEAGCHYEKRRKVYEEGKLEEWQEDLLKARAQKGTVEVRSFMTAARAGILRQRCNELSEMIELRESNIELPAVASVSGDAYR